MRRNEAATLKRYNEQSKCVEESKWHQSCEETETKSKGNCVYLFRLSAFLLRHARFSTLAQCILNFLKKTENTFSGVGLRS